MNYFLQKLRDMKVKNKLILIYVVFGMLPLFLFGVFSFQKINSLLSIQSKNSDTNILNLAVNNLESEINVYNNLSDYMAYSKTVSDVVNGEWLSQFDLYQQLNNKYDPLMSSMRYFHEDIDRITLYVDKVISHGETLRPLSEIKSQIWYKDANSLTPKWMVNANKKEFFCIRKMPIFEKQGKEAYLYIKVNYDKAFHVLKDLKITNYSLYVSNKNDIIYQTNKLNQASEITYKELQTLKKDNHLVSTKVNYTNWEIDFYHQNSVINDQYVLRNTIVEIVIGLIGLLAAFIALYISSKFITNRLKSLEKSISEVENGTLDISIDSEDKDEIGSLIRGFKRMIERIKYLIEQVYESKLLQKNYEMRALQQQINPHFLYNTLSMINFMALEKGHEDISKITLSLSDFYRTSLNKGRNTCELNDELKNMQAYLNIQMMMHDYEFDLDVEIDEEIRHYESPNLILQPIVENAIVHGIDLLEDRKGKIKVYATSNQEDVYIMVEDNGVGMSEEAIEKMLNENSKGYGMRNVNQRIKLLYGEDYGLYIESRIKEGTVVSIKLPKKVYQLDKKNS